MGTETVQEQTFTLEIKFQAVDFDDAHRKLAWFYEAINKGKKLEQFPATLWSEPDALNITLDGSSLEAKE